jgi:endonuclease YncB( thermonuclease family)
MGISMFSTHARRSMINQIRWWLPGLLTALILLGGPGCTDAASDRVDRARVFDGDSFEARRVDGRRVEVRLFGIDAPERHQAWNSRSRSALRELVEGESLRLRVVEVDRYDRLVAEVFLPDGRSVNAAQVAAGNAWVYRRYSNDARLIGLEEEARAARRGLWSRPAHEQIPPWEWRRQRREAGGGR